MTGPSFAAWALREGPCGAVEPCRRGRIASGASRQRALRQGPARRGLSKKGAEGRGVDGSCMWQRRQCSRACWILGKGSQGSRAWQLCVCVCVRPSSRPLQSEASSRGGLHAAMFRHGLNVGARSSGRLLCNLGGGGGAGRAFNSRMPFAGM